MVGMSSLTWGLRAPPGELLEAGQGASQLVVVVLVLQIAWRVGRQHLQGLVFG